MAKLMRRQRTVPGRGFTLIELLIAMNVLAIGLLTGVFPMQITAMYSNSIAFQRATATQIAEEFLETFPHVFRTTGWTNILSDGAAAVPIYPGRPTVPTCPPLPAPADADAPPHVHRFYRSGVEYRLVWAVQDAGDNSLFVTAWVFWIPAMSSSGQMTIVRGNDATTVTNVTCLVVELASMKYCNLGDSQPGRCP